MNHGSRPKMYITESIFDDNMGKTSIPLNGSWWVIRDPTSDGRTVQSVGQKLVMRRQGGTLRFYRPISGPVPFFTD